jgi:hypothetical protein
VTRCAPTAISSSRGRPAETIVEIIEHDPPVRLVTVTHAPGVDIRSTLTFRAAVSATRLSWTSELRAHGLLRLLAPLLTVYAGRQAAAIWRNLKRTLETESHMEQR